MGYLLSSGLLSQRAFVPVGFYLFPICDILLAVNFIMMFAKNLNPDRRKVKDTQYMNYVTLNLNPDRRKVKSENTQYMNTSWFHYV